MPSMKNDKDSFALPVVSDKASGLLGQTQWRSLPEKNGANADKKQDEFPRGFFDHLDRRGFLQMLGGSAAAASLAACWRPPDEKIYPYTRAPDTTPGVPQHYASSLEMLGYGMGVLVEAYDGRPIKVEGNQLFPSSRGTTSIFEQAALQRMYDPMRAKQLVRKGSPLGWANFLVEAGTLMARHQKDGGQKLRFLVAPTTSPSVAQLRNQLRQKLPNAKFYAYQPVSQSNAQAGAQAAFGAPLETSYDLQKADVIVSLDSDFLMWDPERLKLNKQFADRRVPENGLNRLYVVEPTLTVTGTNADHRLRVKPSEVLNVARGLAQALASGAADLGQFGGAQLSEKGQKFVQAVAKDLSQKRGRSVVIAGFRQPAAVHALAHAINQALGNVGQTVTFRKAVQDVQDGGAQALRQLQQEIDAGAVDTLIVDAWNPVYSAPADVDLAAALKKVGDVLYLGYYEDETSRSVNWLIPQAHEFESWGDGRGPDGVVCITQPLIAPLFAGVSPVSFWAALQGQGEKTAHELVKGYWAQRAGQDPAAFETSWRKILADGIVTGTQEAQAEAAFNAGGVSQALQSSPAAGEGFELNLVPDYKLWDGRFGNLSWMKELPDPVSKVTWENTVTVSPQTAKALSVEAGDVVKLTLRDKTAQGPVYVLPGHADEVVTVALGYGRTSPSEEVANTEGFNAYALRFTDAPYFASGLKVEKTGKSAVLAITQDHWSMEGRDIALMADVSEMEALNEAVWRNRESIEKNQVMQEPVDYSDGYKWGMAVDMGRCTSCNACVVACQSENNIPTVGKDQVHRSREMHWIMIDRYFVGDDLSEPDVVPQPRFCVHCETAPCEYVCPVNATVHSDEGLNDMVYNRCVGTRYCSNNCPYKVRRFNYLHWNADLKPTEKMRMNPDVTVRQRGVMEKCTYCVQRIERARITTRIAGRKIQEGDIVTACQQACPADALVFGNLNDPNSKVAKLHADKRRYDLLYSLGTRPRTVHLARIKNQNPELATAKKATAEEHH